MVYIGNSIVEPDVIFEVAETLRESNHWGVAMLPYARTHTRSNPVILNASHLFSLSRKCRKENGMKLSELLREIMTFKTTNPLDGIFALIGLASDVGPEFIDYSLQLRDVHINVAKQALTSNREESTSPLDFLLSVRGDSFNDNSITPGLPSWAPNIRRYDLAEDAAFVPLLSMPLTHGERMPLQLSFGPDESLQLLGHVVGAVQTVIAEHPYTLPRTARMNKTYCLKLQRWESEAHRLASSLGSDDIPLAYARSLAFISDNSVDRVSEHLESYKAFHEMLDLLPRTLPPFEDEETLTLKEIAALNTRIDQRSPTCRHFTEVFDRYSAGRRFAIIEDTYIGWVPAGTKPGDKICAFQSCLVPFAVRPCGKGYRLLGGCFISGLMNGEMNESPRENAEVIILY